MHAALAALLAAHFDRQEYLSSAQYEAYRDYVLHDILPVLEYLDQDSVEIDEPESQEHTHTEACYSVLE